ncbi:hypothetical protein FCM35_KLT16265 [Carex littledalei]|uniref:Uncharacterized protein n=1 Tax=Carex littledalei TaxID=544730 RepID=A0A833RS49_9POAL|nr:hypothetical protein FCM35_KLT16265 [Carex littledalei]
MAVFRIILLSIIVVVIKGSMADNADKDAGSQWEVAVRRQPPRFTKAQISAKRGRVLKQSHRPPPPPSYREEPKLPTLREGCEIDATVAPPNPEPVAQPPPHPPSDAPPHTPNPTVPPPNPSPVAPPHPPSDAPQSKPPPPNTSEVVATVPSPNPPPNPPPKKSVRGRAKHNNSSTVRPLRRSSRLNPLSTFLQDEPTDKDVSCVATADVSQPLEHSVTVADVQIDDSEPFVEPREPEPQLAAPLVQPEVAAPSLKIFWGPNPGVLKRSRPSQSGGKIIHHVAGSISAFRHAQKLESEKGSSVGLKEVFDRMHLKDSDAGKVYVNEKAEAKMKCFEDLKRQYGGVMSDESLWELAVDGEDRRGRLFGFGNRSRISKVSQALAAEDATVSDPAKSTATSAVDENERFTRSQVAVLIASKLADERRAFAAEIAAQEKRHKEELALHKKNDEYNQTLFAALFRATGAPLPPPNEGTSKGHDGEGANGGGEGPKN